MVWPLRPHRPSDARRLALAYSRQFDFPLTPKEIWYWQPFTSFSVSQLCRQSFSQPRRLLRLRARRRHISGVKYVKAVSVAHYLRLIPFVQAVFVTGALAMFNCPRHDDIDIMVITSPHTLWLTRPVLVLLLRIFRLRRDPQLPEHSSPRVSDKICDNLYLDVHHLLISQTRIDLARDFYLAHEILQAKPLYDRGGIHYQFLAANFWVKKYLPIAYADTLKQCKHIDKKQHANTVVHVVLFFFNYLFFIMQYFHMRPGITNEKIGLGYAFFHPRATVV